MTYHSHEPVYIAIADRFLRFRPQILIGQHIEKMIKIGRTVSEGIEFVAKSSNTLQLAIVSTRTQEDSRLQAFHWDNRKIWIHALAALATDGEGYREIGTPGLHCAIGKVKCSVHIDEFGFVGRGANGGTYFTPECVRHVVDELVWRAILRPKLIKGLQLALPSQLAEPAAQLLDRTYIITPSAANNYNLAGNKFKPRLGVGVKFIEKKQINLKFEYTCGNLNCSDNQAKVKLSVEF